MEGGFIQDYTDCLMALDVKANMDEPSGTNDEDDETNNDSLPSKEHEHDNAITTIDDPDGEGFVPADGDTKLVPVLGMEFDSDDAAMAFYDAYAMRMGFGFRVEGYYKKKKTLGDGKKKRDRMSQREGCNAMMEVIKKGTGTWARLPTMDTFFKEHFNARPTLQAFIAEFEKELIRRHELEAQTELDTTYTKPTLKTASPIEKQAAEIYTRAVFDRFQEEFVQSIGYRYDQIKSGVVSKYSVARHDGDEETFIVSFDASKKRADCSCNKFEFSGILCGHILTIFIIFDLRVLPEEYILNRWTRNAKSSAVVDERAQNRRYCDTTTSLAMQQNALRRHQCLWRSIRLRRRLFRRRSLKSLRRRKM
ncbi:Protein FAR1-RELATED SEQUENCE 3 [Acorus calamus]|uniref:Protein FAR1-RELATED SEQUENCE n=1 Tax=Acorus calamus TaxID=4465 RepID=A0AAV9ESL1_ACOCL|nr:Protein FAR1-RELATED SEQUENCE 3 [Acorus calamus]